MKALLFVSVPVLLIAAAFTSNGTPTESSVSRTAANPEVEAMKACARKAKLARARWFFEETGITTTPDSGAAQAYSNQLAAAGIAPKRPIPTPVC
jgi:hypothetical protein